MTVLCQCEKCVVQLSRNCIRNWIFFAPLQHGPSPTDSIVNPSTIIRLIELIHKKIITRHISNTIKNLYCWHKKIPAHGGICSRRDLHTRKIDSHKKTMSSSTPHMEIVLFYAVLLYDKNICSVLITRGILPSAFHSMLHTNCFAYPFWNKS